MATNDASNVAPITEAEYTAAQAAADHFRTSTNSRKRTLHIHDCQHLGRSSHKNMTEKDPHVYPFRYREVCNYCILDLRTGRVDGIDPDDL
jgi:hypothetical protein